MATTDADERNRRSVSKEKGLKEVVVSELGQQPAVGRRSACARRHAARRCFVVDDDAGICKALSLHLAEARIRD